MNFSEVPPFNHLGNITAIGITGAFLYSVVFLPALLAILPLRVKKREERKTSINFLANWVIGNQNILLYAGVFVAVALALFVIRNELNDEFVEYFDDRIEFRRHTDFTAENLTGIYQLDRYLSN
jgi:predicted RND superfamily exporter protein